MIKIHKEITNFEFIQIQHVNIGRQTMRYATFIIHKISEIM